MAKMTLKRHLSMVMDGSVAKRKEDGYGGIMLSDYKEISVGTLKAIREAYKGKEELIHMDKFLCYKLAEVIEFAVCGMGGGLVYGDKGLGGFIDQFEIIKKRYEAKRDKYMADMVVASKAGKVEKVLSIAKAIEGVMEDIDHYSFR